MPDQEEAAKKVKVKLSFKWFYKSLFDLIRHTFTISYGADIEGTVDTIKRDTEFKGHTVWILIFSIMIASIGLNTNAPAVVIGAMLISPLMGPILGIGLALGTNNIQLFFSGIRNFLIMIIVALAASYLYFTVSPFRDAQPELLARTKPQLLDAFIAIFGGLAGIIGNSRSERGNVIPGVAIATALMPPLCTAGYGLSINNYEFFYQAFYLFLMNSSFICITCFIVVKTMNFPLTEFLDKGRERKVKFFIFLVAIVVIIPSCVAFVGLIDEKKYKENISKFIDNEIKFEETFLFKHEFDYSKNGRSTLSLFLLGETLNEEQRAHLKVNLEKYNLNDTDIIFKQRKDHRSIFEQEVEELTVTSENYQQKLEETRQTLAYQEGLIDKMKSEIQLYQEDSMAVGQISSELKTLYPEVSSVAIGKSKIQQDSVLIETHVALIHWKKGYKVSSKTKNKKYKNISEWIKLKLNSDSVIVSSF